MSHRTPTVLAAIALAIVSLDLIYEYGYPEGNHALANVLSGARAQEREAAKKTP